MLNLYLERNEKGELYVISNGRTVRPATILEEQQHKELQLQKLSHREMCCMIDHCFGGVNVAEPILPEFLKPGEEPLEGIYRLVNSYKKIKKTLGKAKRKLTRIESFELIELEDLRKLVLLQRNVVESQRNRLKKLRATNRELNEERKTQKETEEKLNEALDKYHVLLGSQLRMFKENRKYQALLQKDKP